MSVSSNTIFYIGYIPTGILALLGFMKVLRNDKLIKTIFILALHFAILGFFINIKDDEIASGFTPAVFAAPLVYILSFALLRFLYKALYRVEPTYNRVSWYDEGDKREQNWFDVLVHILPMLLSFVFPLFFLGK
jgi:uncharacterized membrane protein YfhO